MAWPAFSFSPHGVNIAKYNELAGGVEGFKCSASRIPGSDVGEYRWTYVVLNEGSWTILRVGERSQARWLSYVSLISSQTWIQSGFLYPLRAIVLIRFMPPEFQATPRDHS
jgi:hypothetical protein